MYAELVAASIDVRTALIGEEREPDEQLINDAIGAKSGVHSVSTHPRIRRGHAPTTAERVSSDRA
jgi:hypothetical protein